MAQSCREIQQYSQEAQGPWEPQPGHLCVSKQGLLLGTCVGTLGQDVLMLPGSGVPSGPLDSGTQVRSVSAHSVFISAMHMVQSLIPPGPLRIICQPR